MIDIQFGICNSKDNVIHKGYKLTFTAQGSFLDNVDIVNPSVKLTNADVINCNYCYIPELKRYYYITNVDIFRTGLYIVSLHCDVLTTYADYLTAENITADSTAQEVTRLEFTNGNALAESAGYILVALGGVN